MKVEVGNRGVCLLNNFKSHRTPKVKNCTKSCKSSACNDNNEDRSNLAYARIMPGGATPKVQPVDLFLAKVTKGYCRNYYGTCMLDAY